MPECGTVGREEEKKSRDGDNTLREPAKKNPMRLERQSRFDKTTMGRERPMSCMYHELVSGNRRSALSRAQWKNKIKSKEIVVSACLGSGARSEWVWRDPKYLIGDGIAARCGGSFLFCFYLAQAGRD